MSKSKLCLEDLSNEILMEIFDYFNGQTIFFLFFNLNYRFNLLCIHYPKFYIDTTDRSLSQRRFQRFSHSIPSKHIHSLKFSFEKYVSRISIRYFSSLHSLTFIDAVNLTQIKEFLEKLPSPEQLHHFSISFRLHEGKVQDLATTIFNLPNLNQLEFYSHGSKLDNVRIYQPLLSLQHLSISCYEWNSFLKLLPFMPSLVSLNLTPVLYGHYSNFIFVQPSSLSKLKILHMNNVHAYNEIDFMFRLCPQVKIFKVECHSKFYIYSMLKAKDWEKILLPMKWLKKIEINVRGLHNGDVIDLSEYETDFWIQRNLKAIEYIDQKPIQRFFASNNQNALLIK